MTQVITILKCDTQQKTFSILTLHAYAGCRCAEWCNWVHYNYCHYAECNFADCYYTESHVTLARSLIYLDSALELLFFAHFKLKRGSRMKMTRFFACLQYRKKLVFNRPHLVCVPGRASGGRRWGRCSWSVVVAIKILFSSLLMFRTRQWQHR